MTDIQRKDIADLDVTERYEVTMLANTYCMMNTGPVTHFSYNAMYECFCIHAKNLTRRLLCPDEVYDILEKIERQVFSFPRGEPTFEQKVKFADCTVVYEWIMKHYDGL